jgi:hypothetical protein
VNAVLLTNPCASGFIGGSPVFIFRFRVTTGCSGRGSSGESSCGCPHPSQVCFPGETGWDGWDGLWRRREAGGSGESGCIRSSYLPLAVAGGEAGAGHAFAVIAQEFLQAAAGLVVGAGAPVDEAVTEADRGVVDDLGFLVGAELFLAAVRGDEAFQKGQKGLRRLMCFIRLCRLWPVSLVH